MKMVLVDESLCVVDVAQVAYDYRSPRPTWAESDPDEFILAVKQAVSSMKPRREIEFSSLVGIVFCTQWKGLVSVDEEGRALHKSILWLDKRAKEECDALNLRLDEPDHLTCADCIPKIMWLRTHEPKTYEKARWFLEINSYIKLFATGRVAVDETNHYGRSFLPGLQRRMDRQLRASCIPDFKVPALVHADERVGRLRRTAAEVWDLPEGVPVYGGLGDIPAITKGSGMPQHLYFGTSGWFATIADENLLDAWPRVSPYLGRHLIRLDGLECVGLARTWAVERFFSEEKDRPDCNELLEKQVRDIDASLSPLLAVPLLFEENPPLPRSVRAALWNMRASDGNADLYNAVLEGVCLLMRRKILACGACPERLMVCGGGARSDHWMQMLSDVTGRRILIPRHVQHVGAIGAASCIFANVPPPALEKEFIPDRERHERYEAKFAEFDSVLQGILDKAKERG